jgi:hypothetical protein
MQQSSRRIYDVLDPQDFRLLRLRWTSVRHADLEGALITCRLLSEEDTASTFDTAKLHNPRKLPLVDAGEYDALSYCWGDDDPIADISIFDNNDVYLGNIEIKPNLVFALRTFRAQMKSPVEEHYFWVDALCIDQENEEEKSAQIQKISHIYRMAQEVRVWLGPRTPMSDIAMSFLDKLDDLDDIDELISNDESNKDWNSFRDLMRRPWFSRRWIIQEIALARDAQVYCGDMRVPWKDFMFAVSLFVEKARDLNKLFRSSEYHHHPDYLGEVDIMSANTLVNVVSTLFRKNESGRVVEHLLSLEDLMSTLVFFEASKPHDFVYAILSLARDATVGLRHGPRRSAAMYEENAHTPLPSPIEVAFSTIPIDTAAGPNVNVALVTSPTSILLPHESFQTTEPVNKMDTTKPAALSNEKNSHLYLKLPEGAKKSRTRANSLQLASMREAEKSDGDGEGEGEDRLEPDPIVVDYKKPALDVYKEFVEFAIRRSKFLDIICRPWALKLADASMPSWIRTLDERSFALHPKEKVYQRTAPDSLVGRPQWDQRIYHASGKTRARLLGPHKNKLIMDKCLATYGFVLDVVGQIDDPATGGIVPASWLKLANCEDTSKGLPERFWRTLVADRDVDGLRQPRAHFQQVCDWAFNKRRPARHNLSVQQILREGLCPTLAEDVLKRVLAVVFDRRLILTRGSENADGTQKTPELLALVPKATRVGDFICILYGCSVPVVLRKKTNITDELQSNKRKATVQLSRQGTLKQRRTGTSSLTPIETSRSSRSGVGATSAAASRSTRSADPAGGTANTQSKNNESVSSDPTAPPTALPTSSFDSVQTSPMNQPDITVSEAQKFGYELIGECFVHGMMAGEAFKHRDDTGNPKEVFLLI